MGEDEWKIVDDVETLKVLTNVLINMGRLKRTQKLLFFITWQSTESHLKVNLFGNARQILLADAFAVLQGAINTFAMTPKNLCKKTIQGPKLI
jgi:hypothetical protein